jgi:hypothetical protein
VPYRCPSCGGEVELARTPLESGLVRLAVLGADDFRLEFDDPALRSALAPLLGPCPHGSEPTWDEAALRPVAARGLAALEAAPELAQLAALWRPRALALCGRSEEVAKGDVLRLRLEGRLAELSQRMDEAREQGDGDEAERLHARYIELGMVYAGRLAAAWRD